MPTYLERYMRGEHEQVWSDLTAMGSGIRNEPLLSDALAVARETMRRVRANIEMLIPRLIVVGYQFGYGWVQPFVRERLLHPCRVMNPASEEIVPPAIPKAFPIRQRLTYQDYLEQAKLAPPVFLPADDREQQIAHLDHMINTTAPAQHAFRDQLRAMQASTWAQPSAAMLVHELEVRAGKLPLAVRAWYELVGGVNFVGDHPQWRALLPETPDEIPEHPDEYLNRLYLLNPLFVYGLDQSVVAHYPSPTAEATGHSTLPLWPTASSKYFDPSGSGSAAITLPSGTMDAVLNPGHQLFVPYLRSIFLWGGFPGWAGIERRPEQDIAFITESLMPF